MIRFKAKFQVYDSNRVGVPKSIKYGENFWCSFNTKKQLIMCNVIYLGEDIYMQQYKWYNGTIELPYGEKFPPYCINKTKAFNESINLHEDYILNVGGEKVGDCILLEIIQIVHDEFDVKHHADGTI